MIGCPPSVKNSLHFRLDVVSNEDRQDEARISHGSQSLAKLPDMPLNAMQ
jgi:hypothetical protein